LIYKHRLTSDQNSCHAILDMLVRVALVVLTKNTLMCAVQV